MARVYEVPELKILIHLPISSISAERRKYIPTNNGIAVNAVSSEFRFRPRATMCWEKALSTGSLEKAQNLYNYVRVGPGTARVSCRGPTPAMRHAEVVAGWGGAERGGAGREQCSLGWRSELNALPAGGRWPGALFEEKEEDRRKLRLQAGTTKV
ncbi:Protein of unknown function [Gryllus bimaculatus]|nr:Protein of unknown function [Gryllus bimaculatus]